MKLLVHVCWLTMTFALVAPALAQEREEWRVTYAVRIAEGDYKASTIRIALPADDPYQQADQVEVAGRGLQTDIVRGDHPEVVFRGPIGKGRRVSVSYRVQLFRFPRTPPPMRPAQDPPVDVIDALSPAPLFPSRSILVREFLETQVAPALQEGDETFRTIYSTVRKQLLRRKDGASLALDVLRSGEGKRIGIERCFTTLLRCAHFPARFVEGIKLDSNTRRKRVFWTDVWSQGDWSPTSASGGWSGRRPASYLALVRDGRRVVKLEGEGELSYYVHSEPLSVPVTDRKKHRR